MTAGERGCAVSPGLGVVTPKLRNRMGEGSEEFCAAQVADVPIYLRCLGGLTLGNFSNCKGYEKRRCHPGELVPFQLGALG